MSVHKILIHISDRDKWGAAVKMASACAASESSGVEQIIILADVFAGAVCLACDRKLRSEMEEFCRAGHRILACEQSLRNLNMRPENLLEFIERVPSSLAEIVKLQDASFHYIKI
jgi:intracellular sulfur oxidation DsrE/DsrF family protein